MHKHEDDAGKIMVHAHGHDHGETKKHEHVHNELVHQTNLAAMGIGIIHGLAGFSHILLLLPTLAFPNKTEAIMYLTGFGAGTIFAMVLFSFILGLMAHYSSQHKKEIIFKSINAIAGFAAIFIGFFWLWNTW